jgi:hypothetical protein
MKHRLKPQTVRVALIERAWCKGAFAELLPHLSEKERDWAELEDILVSGNEAKLRQMWQRNREPVLEEWIRVAPGTRPPLWWQFDAPERRRRNESEATYLQRHKLLRAIEARRIPAHAKQPPRVRLKLVVKK